MIAMAALEIAKRKEKALKDKRFEVEHPKEKSKFQKALGWIQE